MPLSFLYAKVHLLCRNSNFCANVFSRKKPKPISRGSTTCIHLYKRACRNIGQAFLPARRGPPEGINAYAARTWCIRGRCVHHTPHAPTQNCKGRRESQNKLEATPFFVGFSTCVQQKNHGFCYILRFNITANTTGAPINGVMKFMGKHPPSPGR